MGIKVEVKSEGNEATVAGDLYKVAPEVAKGTCIGCVFDDWERDVKPCSKLPCVAAERDGGAPVIWVEVKDV